jgi:hypothetical protein
VKAGAVNPSRRIARHQPQQQPLGRGPCRKPAEASDTPQDFGSLVQFEMAEIFLDDGGHCLAQRGGEILHCHGLLLLRVGEQGNQALG